MQHNSPRLPFLSQVKASSKTKEEREGEENDRERKAIMKLYKSIRGWVQERTFEEGDEGRVKVVLSQSKEQPRKS